MLEENTMEGYRAIWLELAGLYGQWLTERRRFSVRSLVRYWWARGELKRDGVTALQQKSARRKHCLSPNKTPLADDSLEGLLIWLCIGCELEGYATLPDPALDPEPYLRLLKCLVMYKLELSPREVKMSKLEKAHQDVFIRN